MRKKLYSFSVLLVIATILSSSRVFSHGEDSAGPHGGNIRMPGAFHTELIKTGKDKFKVYLLDMNWKNPTTRNSSVTAILKSARKKTSVSCASEQEYFVCNLPKKFEFKSLKTISLQVNREGMTGALAVYSVPLKFPK